jgi:hypothetical protein
LESASRCARGAFVCDVWLELNDQFYIVSIWSEYTNPDDFWAFQAGADALVKSLVFK